MSEEGESGQRALDASTDKESARRFVLRASKPFSFDTEGLGRVQARRMTLKARQVFRTRQRTLVGVPDATVVRAYLGAVSGLPSEDEEAVPPALTEEEVAKLTEADVERFALSYLHQVVGANEVAQPIKELAQFIRKERSRSEQTFKEVAKTMQSAMAVDRTADLMKHWRELSGNISGSVGSVSDEMAKLFGPGNALAPSISDALRDQQLDRQSQMDAILNRGRDPLAGLLPDQTATERLITGDDLISSRAVHDFQRDQEAQIEALMGSDHEQLKKLLGEQSASERLFGSDLDALAGKLGGVGSNIFGRTDPSIFHAHKDIDKDYLRSPIAVPMDDKESPVGRTALAVEDLRLAGERMEDAMGVIVEQAGNVSGLIGQVVVQIKEEAGKSQRGARWALGIAVLALVASLAVEVGGYLADRSEAKAGDVASERMAEHLVKQNQLLRAMLAQEIEAGRRVTTSGNPSSVRSTPPDLGPTPPTKEGVPAGQSSQNAP